MALATLQPGMQIVAFRLQEATAKISNSDVEARLRDAVRDAYKSTGQWCYIVAVFGDDKSGDVVYSCDDGLKKASYTCSKSGATIATDAAVDVVPLTTYELESTAVTEAGARNSKRDLTQLQTIHDASAALGANCSLAESKKGTRAGALKLIEVSDWAKDDALRLIESTATPMRMKMKIIQAGKGSSAFYPAEVLQRDGPNVFTKGTHIYINHATSAEEAARPEGDWHKLAGALDSNAFWNESDQSLYAYGLFTSDHAGLVKEKAAFTGMSIRAAGVAESKKTQDGLPVLKELTHAESVDVVTRAGAGGMILTEAARPHEPQEVQMDEKQITALVEAAVTKAVAAVSAPVTSLTARALRGDAMVEANSIMSTMSLHESVKARVVENVTRDGAIPLKDGAIDSEKFKALVIAEAKREGAYAAQFAGNGAVRGLGVSTTEEVDPAKLREAEERAASDRKRFTEASKGTFERLMGNPQAAEKAATRGAA